MRHAFLFLMPMLSMLPRRRTATPKFIAAPVAAVALSSLLVLAGCAAQKPFQPDLFSTTISPYAHTFAATSAQACEAARRAVLSQGYATSLSTAEMVDASKGFQPSPENHVSVSFHIVCTPGESSTSTSVLYVNAVQDNYALKKSDTSASVGLSILGSVSLPIRSNSDSMVKISSETIPPGLFYERFFGLVDHYLKTVVRATPISDADVISSRLAPLPSPTLGNAQPVPVIVGATPATSDTVMPLPTPTPPPLGQPTSLPAHAASTDPASSTNATAGTGTAAASATPTTTTPMAASTASSNAVANATAAPTTAASTARTPTSAAGTHDASATSPDAVPAHNASAAAADTATVHGTTTTSANATTLHSTTATSIDASTVSASATSAARSGASATTATSDAAAIAPLAASTSK